MGKVKDFFKNIWNKIKNLFRKKEEPAAVDGAKLTVRSYKNGTKINYIQITDLKVIKNICSIIENFSKWSDYNIVYDLPQNDIKIYYTVKKAADFEDIKNNDKEVK